MSSLPDPENHPFFTDEEDSDLDWGTQSDSDWIFKLGQFFGRIWNWIRN